ncbi:hypothetical protein MP228_009224 [Amoeboaphelidium protococcarum]|nr:hypothetical protein MP228_009224 [Amoeboaphelidium protococcarum]
MKTAQQPPSQYESAFEQISEKLKELQLKPPLKYTQIAQILDRSTPSVYSQWRMMKWCVRPNESVYNSIPLIDNERYAIASSEDSVQQQNLEDYIVDYQIVKGGKKQKDEEIKKSSFTKRKFAYDRWSVDELRKLNEAIEKYLLDENVDLGGQSRWPMIAAYVGSKSPRQCYFKYRNSAKPDIKRGRFTPGEARMILELYKQYGRDWTTIAQFTDGRTDNQCRLFIKRFLSFQHSHVDTSSDQQSSPISD